MSSIRAFISFNQSHPDYHSYVIFVELTYFPIQHHSKSLSWTRPFPWSWTAKAKYRQFRRSALILARKMRYYHASVLLGHDTSFYRRKYIHSCFPITRVFWGRKFQTESPSANQPRMLALATMSASTKPIDPIGESTLLPILLRGASSCCVPSRHFIYLVALGS